jgi:hypothetical protein
MGFELTTPVFDQAKRVHAFERAATVIGADEEQPLRIPKMIADQKASSLSYGTPFDKGQRGGGEIYIYIYNIPPILPHNKKTHLKYTPHHAPIKTHPLPLLRTSHDLRNILNKTRNSS